MSRSASLRLGDCSFDPPQGWASQVLVVGPLEGGFRPNFVAVSGPSLPDETAQAFATRQLGEVKKNTLDYQIVREGPASYAQVKGWLREHTFLQGGTRIGQLQLYVVSGGLARTFTFTHLANKLEGARQQATAFFDTIKVFASSSDRLKLEGTVRG